MSRKQLLVAAFSTLRQSKQLQETGVATSAGWEEWETHSFDGTARPTNIYMEGVASVVGDVVWQKIRI